MSKNCVFSPSRKVSDIFSTFFGHLVDIPFLWAVQRFARYNSFLSAVLLGKCAHKLDEVAWLGANQFWGELLCLQLSVFLLTVRCGAYETHFPTLSTKAPIVSKEAPPVSESALIISKKAGKHNCK